MNSREAGVVRNLSPSNGLQRATADGFLVTVSHKSVGSWRPVPQRAEVLTKDMQTWKTYICGKIHHDKRLHLSHQMDLTPGTELTYGCTSSEAIHGIKHTANKKGSIWQSDLSKAIWLLTLRACCHWHVLPRKTSANPSEVLSYLELCWSTNISFKCHLKESLKSTLL